MTTLKTKWGHSRIVVFGIVFALVALLIPFGLQAFGNENVKGGEQSTTDKTNVNIDNITIKAGETIAKHTCFYYIDLDDSGQPVSEIQEAEVLTLKVIGKVIFYVDSNNVLNAKYTDDNNVKINRAIFANGLEHKAAAENWWSGADTKLPPQENVEITGDATITVEYEDLPLVNLIGTGDEGHKEFHIQNIVDGEEVNNSTKEKIEYSAIIDSAITVTEDGVLTARYKYNDQFEQHAIIDGKMTAKAKDGYKFDHFTINDNVIKPGESYKVEKGTDINFKAHYVADKTDTADTLAQTSDYLIYILIGLGIIVLITVIVLLVKRSKSVKK